MSVGDLEPKCLWEKFDFILKYPHPSKYEDKLIQAIKSFVKSKNLEIKEDNAKNFVVILAATKGYETKDTIILQAHLDMVCEKTPETIIDFFESPINTYIDSDWIKAKGTTLGADNGIGVAAALALIDDVNIKHPKLELLFTVEEEIGLNGASALGTNLLTGKYFLNLDSSEEGVFYAGCSGGAQLTMNKNNYNLINIPNHYKILKLKVSSLLGGHSGINIVENRANANKILSQILFKLLQIYEFNLISFEGGTKHNAIPRDAFSYLAIAENNVTNLINDAKIYYHHIMDEFNSIEKKANFFINIENTNDTTALTVKDSVSLINFLQALPNGVHTMHRLLPGLVETSSNFAIVNFVNNNLHICMSVRSSLKEAKHSAIARILAIANLYLEQVTISNEYSAWTFNVNSELLQKALIIWENKYGIKPLIKATHGGLECGIILEKYPHLEAISFGPTILGLHSPTERLSISSANKFYEFLKLLIESL